MINKIKDALIRITILLISVAIIFTLITVMVVVIKHFMGVVFVILVLVMMLSLHVEGLDDAVIEFFKSKRRKD